MTGYANILRGFPIIVKTVVRNLIFPADNRIILLYMQSPKPDVQMTCKPVIEAETFDQSKPGFVYIDST